MKSLKLAAMTVSCAALMLILGSETAFARTYYRSCNARYEVEVTKIGAIPTPSLPRRTVRGTIFKGTGKCGPRTRINDCRRRARDYCHNCMKDHWFKWLKYKPESCRFSSGRVGISGYNTKYLQTTIKNHICSIDRDNRAGQNIKFKAYRYTWGNKGCGSRLKKSMLRTLGYGTVTCPARGQ